MTLEEAIRINTEVAENPLSAIRTDFPQAAKLGIEALKRINYLKTVALYRTDVTLPGETEE